MKKRFYQLIALFCCCTSLAMAQTVTVSDTLTLTVTSIVPEPDPNAGTYTFSFYGTDNNNKSQKVQILYNSTSMYGTFTNNDFYNWDGSLGSGSYNYIRRADSDLGFYSFKQELTATVTDDAGATVIDVNGLINVYSKWTRVLLHGVIPAPAPDDTIRTDLGLVSLIPNTFYEYLVLEAHNSDYSLATGLIGYQNLAAGTYYMTEMLRPEFVTADGDTILPASAELTVTEASNGQFNLLMHLLGEDNILYLLSMHTGEVEITDTVTVNCTTGQVTYSEVYNMFQFYGEDSRYVAALSVTPGVLTGNTTVISPDSIMLTFSTIGDKINMTETRVFGATASLDRDPEHPTRLTLHATMLGTNGICYQVSMPVGWSPMPEAKDTVVVDCGEGVLRVDYTRGVGMAGLVLSHQVGEVVRSAYVVFYTGDHLGGWYENEYFDYEVNDAMYVQRVWLDHSGTSDTIRTYTSFIKAAQMQIDSIHDTIYISLDAYAKNDTLYRFSAWMAPKRALTGEQHAYSVSYLDECSMMGMREASDANQAIYQLNVQRADGFDSEGYLTGDAEIWNFRILQTNWDGIQGEFGYSTGTMDDSKYHVIYEGGTEIYLSPVAGTLHVTAMQQVQLSIPGQLRPYKAWIYAITATVLAENGQFYNLTGQTYMVCFEAIDEYNERLIELTELQTALDEVLGEQNLRVKKVLRNGILLLESTDRTYTISGQIVK